MRKQDTASESQHVDLYNPLVIEWDHSSRYTKPLHVHEQLSWQPSADINPFKLMLWQQINTCHVLMSPGIMKEEEVQEDIM